MKLKKALTLLMAAVLVLSLAAPAFAATYGNTQAAGDAVTGLDNLTDAASFEFDGTTQGATIKAIVPTSAMQGLLLNPYSIDLSVVSASLTGFTFASGDTNQVYAPSLYIANLSDFPLDVNYTAGVTANGDVVLATAALKGTETTKSVLLYVETQVTSNTTVPTDWAEGYTKADNQVVFTAKGASPKTATRLPACSDVGTNNTVAASDGYLWYTIGGACAGSAASVWTAEDNVSVNLAFTFRPAANETT